MKGEMKASNSWCVAAWRNGESMDSATAEGAGLMYFASASHPPDFPDLSYRESFPVRWRVRMETAIL